MFAKKKKVFHIETIVLYIYLFNVVRIIDMALLFIVYTLYFRKTSPSKKSIVHLVSTTFSLYL